jgi:hypothetical protein
LVIFDKGCQVTQMVGIAQGVKQEEVLKVSSPRIMDEDAPELGQNTNRIGRFPTPLGMWFIVSQVRCADGMQQGM